MMLDDPCEFMRFMSASCEEFEKQELLLQAKKNLEERQTEDLLDNDALAVFLLSVPKEFIKKADKYNRIVAEMKAKRLTSLESIS